MEAKVAKVEKPAKPPLSAEQEVLAVEVMETMAKHLKPTADNIRNGLPLSFTGNLKVGDLHACMQDFMGLADAHELSIHAVCEVTSQYMKEGAGKRTFVRQADGLQLSTAVNDGVFNTTVARILVMSRLYPEMLPKNKKDAALGATVTEWRRVDFWGKAFEKHWSAEWLEVCKTIEATNKAGAAAVKRVMGLVGPHISANDRMHAVLVADRDAFVAKCVELCSR